MAIRQKPATQAENSGENLEKWESITYKNTSNSY